MSSTIFVNNTPGILTYNIEALERLCGK
jgi:hypothetical protein